MWPNTFCPLSKCHTYRASQLVLLHNHIISPVGLTILLVTLSVVPVLALSQLVRDMAGFFPWSSLGWWLVVRKDGGGKTTWMLKSSRLASVPLPG